MSTRSVSSQPPFIPPDHWEQLSSSISSLTVDPYKNALCYFFPFMGAFFTSYQTLRSDPSFEAMMPQEPTEKILKEIQDLTKCAGIKREVLSYVALNHQFSSCGGLYSLTKPALFLPEQHLFRRSGKSFFGQEKGEENLSAKRWIFSDNETRFLIARELGKIKENNALLRLAIKVSVLVVLFTIYALPFSWLTGIALFTGVLGVYIVSERLFQGRADLVGVEILNEKIPNARAVAINTLEKMRQQNLYRRKYSKIARLYITPSGNNILDLVHPSLDSRIRRLKA